jgi:hypothetical protein
MIDHRQNQNSISTIPTCWTHLQNQNDLFNNVTVCAEHWKTLGVCSIAESGQCLCLFAVSSKAFDCKVFFVVLTFLTCVQNMETLFTFSSFSFRVYFFNLFLSFCLSVNLSTFPRYWHHKLIGNDKEERFFFRRKHFSVNIF